MFSLGYEEETEDMQRASCCGIIELGHFVPCVLCLSVKLSEHVEKL